MRIKLSLIILVLAFVLDLIFGDPHKIPHPVRAYGYLIKKLEDFFRARDKKNTKSKLKIYGLYILLISITLAFFVYSIPILVFKYFNLNIAFVMFATLSTYQLIACKSLRTESMKVYKSLKKDDIEDARKNLSMIVGRDTERLDKEDIIKATIETVAENFSDGVIAPICYYGIFFVQGIVIYKMVNTLDSMIGYKDKKYKDIGYFSAKLDDILNFIPARIAAILLLISSILITNSNIKNGIKIFLRDRYKHASPNSAQTESVVAGIFGIRLAGPAYYFAKRYEKEFIGDELRKVDVEDIKRVNNLMYISSIIFVILLVITHMYL